METETPDAPQIEDFPSDPDTEVPEPDELPDEFPGDAESEEADELEPAEVPADPATLQ